MKNQTIILQIDKTLAPAEYSKLYFELRKQVWSGCLLLPPDIKFLGVADPDSNVALLIEKGGESMDAGST